MRGETWLGGFIRNNADGSNTYVIRKSVGGKRYDVSTRCSTERAALKQLERFEADPESYGAGSEEKRAAIFLDAELAEEFLTYCRDVKKNSRPWLYQQRRYVAWWGGKLKGVSLAKVTLRDHIHPALKDQAARPHRIATIKAIYAWLRKVKNEIAPAEDPTFATLTVPQAKPGARAMKNKAIPSEAHRKARAMIKGHWGWAMDVQAGTGWHITEVKRFADGGAIELHPNGKVAGVAGVLVCPEAKGGGQLRTPVGARVLDSARRLLSRAAERKQKLISRGSFDVARYRNAVKAACVAANEKAIEAANKSGTEPKLIEVFTPGRFRHTVGTEAINSGASPAAVSAFLNHKDPRTLKRFYATHAVSPKIPTLLDR